MREGKRGGSLSARGTWETVHGTAAFRQNLGVDLTLTEHRSTDRLIPNRHRSQLSQDLLAFRRGRADCQRLRTFGINNV